MRKLPISQSNKISKKTGYKYVHVFIFKTIPDTRSDITVSSLRFIYC